MEKNHSVCVCVRASADRCMFTSDLVAPPIMNTKIRCPILLKSLDAFFKTESLWNRRMTEKRTWVHFHYTNIQTNKQVMPLVQGCLPWVSIVRRARAGPRCGSSCPHRMWSSSRLTWSSRCTLWASSVPLVGRTRRVHARILIFRQFSFTQFLD